MAMMLYIIGADFLMNEGTIAAITPTSLIFSPRHKSAMVPLYESKEDQQINLIKIKENVTVPPRTIKPVHVGMVFDETNEEKTPCHYELNNLKVTADQDFNPNKT